MQINLSIGIAVVLSMAHLSGPASAEVRQGIDVSVSQDEVIEDDVYIFGQKVSIDGTIKGDAVVFGRAITVNGSVDGDLIAAAQKVTVNGRVADDARIGCQILTLQNNAKIGDDLIAAGYSLECAKSSQIGGQVKFAGYQSRLAGHVEKEVNLTSANCELSGSFGGDVEALVNGGNFGPVGIGGADFPTVSLGLTVTESANFNGNLNYLSKSEANIDPQSTIAGEVTHSRLDSSVGDPPTLSDRAIAFAKQFFALLLVGSLIVCICPKWTRQVAANVQHRPLASIAWGGITSIIVIAVASLLLVVTIAIAVLLGSISLDNLLPAWLWSGLLTTAVLIVGFWIFSAWAAKIIVCYWAGNRIISDPNSASRRLLALTLGVFAFVVLTRIPTVGSVISIVGMLIGIGSAAIFMSTKSGNLVSEKPIA